MDVAAAIETDRLVISALDLIDVQAVQQLLDDPAVVAILAPSESRRADQWIQASRAARCILPFRFIARDRQTLVGAAHVTVKPETHPLAGGILVGEFLIMVHPAHRRQGYATEAIRALNQWCLYEMGPSVFGYPVRRMVGLCAADNLASAQVMQRAGMIEESALDGTFQVAGGHAVAGVRRFVRDGGAFAPGPRAPRTDPFRPESRD